MRTKVRLVADGGTEPVSTGEAVDSVTQWRTASLGELCDSVRYGITASASPEPDHGPRLLRITDIVPPRIDWAGVPNCDIPESNIEKFQLKQGDIVVARTGATVGYAKHIDYVPGRAVFASYLVRFRIGPRADSSYVGHIVQSAAYKEFVLSHAGGAAQPNANAQILGAFPIPLPELRIQRRISAVLSAFNELIETNERRIELLEDLARRLYREWFGRFRFPGHEDAEFEDSHLGLIPKGWSALPLRDLVTTQYGFTASAAQDAVGPKFLRGMDINKRSFINWAAVPYCKAGEEEITKFGLQVGDVCVIRMADPGKVGIVEKSVDAVFASYLVRIRACDTRLSPYLLFHHLDSPEYQDWIMGSSTGATRKSASAKVLTEPRVLVPTPEIAGAFESHASDLRRSLTTLVDANAALSATRDLLLPRLVSGRVDVSDLDLGDLLPAEAP